MGLQVFDNVAGEWRPIEATRRTARQQMAEHARRLDPLARYPALRHLNECERLARQVRDVLRLAGPMGGSR